MLLQLDSHIGAGTNEARTERTAISDPSPAKHDLRLFADGLSWPVKLTIRTNAGVAVIAHVVPYGGYPLVGASR